MGSSLTQGRTKGKMRGYENCESPARHRAAGRRRSRSRRAAAHAAPVIAAPLRVRLRPARRRRRQPVPAHARGDGDDRHVRRPATSSRIPEGRSSGTSGPSPTATSRTRRPAPPRNGNRLVLPNNAERFVTTTRTLKSQLAAAGYAPADITYLALSHYHYDHTANANLFAASTWLVRRRNATRCSPRSRPICCSHRRTRRSRNSKTIVIRHGGPRRLRRRHGRAEVVSRPHAGASGAVS